MLIKDIERQEIENILRGYDWEFTPLRQATAEVCDYINEKAKEIEIEVTNPTLSKLIEYIEINIQKYWDKMGNTGGDEYFDNATQEELIALGQYKAFEKIQNFIFIENKKSKEN